MFDSPLLGKFMLAAASRHGLDLNQTKLHKIMYIIYGYFLCKNIEITQETPQAWPFGPVFPRARKHIDFGKEYNFESNEFDSIKNEAELASEIEKIVRRFGHISAQKLVDWTHQTDSPWTKTINKKDFKWSNQIDKELIKEYFENLNILD